MLKHLLGVDAHGRVELKGRGVLRAYLKNSIESKRYYDRGDTEAKSDATAEVTIVFPDKFFERGYFVIDPSTVAHIDALVMEFFLQELHFRAERARCRKGDNVKAATYRLIEEAGLEDFEIVNQVNLKKRLQRFEKRLPPRKLKKS